MSLHPALVVGGIPIAGLILCVLGALALGVFHDFKTDLEELTRPGKELIVWNEKRFTLWSSIYSNRAPERHRLRILLHVGSGFSFRRLQGVVATRNLSRRTGQIVEVAIRWDALTDWVDQVWVAEVTSLLERLCRTSPDKLVWIKILTGKLEPTPRPHFAADRLPIAVRREAARAMLHTILTADFALHGITCTAGDSWNQSCPDWDPTFVLEALALQVNVLRAQEKYQSRFEKISLHVQVGTTKPDVAGFCDLLQRFESFSSITLIFDRDEQSEYKRFICNANLPFSKRLTIVTPRPWLWEPAYSFIHQHIDTLSELHFVCESHRLWIDSRRVCGSDLQGVVHSGHDSRCGLIGSS